MSPEFDAPFLPVLRVSKYATTEEIQELLAAQGARPGDRFRIITTPTPLTPATPGRYYIAWCLTCTPIVTGREHGETPFRNEHTRDAWCASHTRTTGHHDWWVLDDFAPVALRTAARIRATGPAGATFRARIAHADDVRAGWRDPATETTPTGCAICGRPQRRHGKVWHASSGRREDYVPPTQSEILVRMQVRRQRRLERRQRYTR